MTSKIIAVTGGIGSGKSEVTKYLRKLGYNTIDCDDLARQVSARPKTVERVGKLLGKEYIVDGQLNRSAIRNKVFADAKLLSQYNLIFFDEVKLLLEEQISALIRNAKEIMQNDCFIFVEISVFDAFDFPWNEIWLIEADARTRIERAQKRDNVSRKSLCNIVDCQCICGNFTRKFINEGDLQSLYSQIDVALTNFMKI